MGGTVGVGCEERGRKAAGEAMRVGAGGGRSQADRRNPGSAWAAGLHCCTAAPLHRCTFLVLKFDLNLESSLPRPKRPHKLKQRPAILLSLSSSLKQTQNPVERFGGRTSPLRPPVIVLLSCFYLPLQSQARPARPIFPLCSAPNTKYFSQAHEPQHHP